MPIPTSAETEAIARQLAALRGQTVEEVVSAALRAELMRERRGRSAAPPVELTPAQRAEGRAYHGTGARRRTRRW
jgi:hypothetical protein